MQCALVSCHKKNGRGMYRGFENMHHVAELALSDLQCGRVGLAELAGPMAELVFLIGRDGLWPTWMFPEFPRRMQTL